jgi:uncharacterized membrane protein required for colicin V production
MTISFGPTDVVIVALVALSGYAGFRGGFYDSLLRLSGFYLAVTISLALLQYVARFFNYVMQLPPNMSLLLGFSFIFGLLMLLQVFFMHWMHQIIKMDVVKWFDLAFGTILGAVKGLFAASLVTLGFSLLPLAREIQTTETRSLFFRPTRCVLSQNFNLIGKLFPLVPNFESTLAATAPRLAGADDRTPALLQELQNCRPQK